MAKEFRELTPRMFEKSRRNFIRKRNAFADRGLSDFVSSLEAIRICMKSECSDELVAHATDDWLRYGRLSSLPPLFLWAARLPPARAFAIALLLRELPKGEIEASLGAGVHKRKATKEELSEWRIDLLRGELSRKALTSEADFPTYTNLRISREGLRRALAVCSVAVTTDLESLFRAAAEATKDGYLPQRKALEIAREAGANLPRKKIRELWKSLQTPREQGRPRRT